MESQANRSLSARELPGAADAEPAIRRVLARIGALEVRLARTPDEVHRAQALRFEVFCREMSARPSPVGRLRRRDTDGFDAHCDHLLVIDNATDQIVGTSRLLRQEKIGRCGGFYSSGEFETADLVARKRPLKFVELGRSCVLAPYRSGRALEVLWAGIWSYVQHFERDVMIGCASFTGTDPDRLALPLSFLHLTARAPEDWRVRPLPGRAIAMDRMAPATIDTRAAVAALPPLLKGYLRLGAYIGEGAVVDCRFGTTDVCVVLPVPAINPRYFNRFGPPRRTQA